MSSVLRCVLLRHIMLRFSMPNESEEPRIYIFVICRSSRLLHFLFLVFLRFAVVFHILLHLVLFCHHHQKQQAVVMATHFRIRCRLGTSCMMKRGVQGCMRIQSYGGECRRHRSMLVRAVRGDIEEEEEEGEEGRERGGGSGSGLSAEEKRMLLVAATQRVKELGRKGKTREALEALAAMGREGVQPDVIAATACVEACCQNGEMELAVRVFRELFGERLAPDEVSFNALIRGYASPRSSSVDWRGINNIIRLMRQYDAPASTLTYTTLLQLCSKTNDVERGMQIIEQMGREGVEVDSSTLTAVKNRRALRSHLKKVYSSSAGL